MNKDTLKVPLGYLSCPTELATPRDLSNITFYRDKETDSNDHGLAYMQSIVSSSPAQTAIRMRAESMRVTKYVSPALQGLCVPLGRDIGESITWLYSFALLAAVEELEMITVEHLYKTQFAYRLPTPEGRALIRQCLKVSNLPKLTRKKIGKGAEGSALNYPYLWKQVIRHIKKARQ